MASKHNAVLKSSFCFTRKATEFSFCTMLLSVQTGQYLAEVDAAEI